MNQFNLQLYNFMYTVIDMTSLTSQFTISWIQSAVKKHNQTPPDPRELCWGGQRGFVVVPQTSWTEHIRVEVGA